METPAAPSLSSDLGRGIVAGLVGTVGMTAFQRFVEMPLTGRAESEAPLKLAERILPIRPRSPKRRRQVNHVVHFALGVGWGAAYGAIAHAGLRGERAVAATFAAMYPGDVGLATALGVYTPGKWSARETTIDVVDKLVQAQVTGTVFDRALSGR